MIVVPEPSQVTRSFSRAAPSYDAPAHHQRCIAARLCARIPREPPPARILELGCGTGILTAELRHAFPSATLTAIDIAPGMIETCVRRWPGAAPPDFRVADAVAYRAPHPCNLVASSCSFQWFSDRDAALARAAENLAPGGIFALAVPVSGTLQELTESFAQALGAPRPDLDLWDEPRYRAAIEAAGLAITHMAVEDIAFQYADPLDVLRMLKDMGATLHGHGGIAALSAAATRRLAGRYRQLYADAHGNVAATYRVLFALARTGSV